MTKDEFRECFADWLAVKKSKVAEWPKLGGVYFKALGGFRPAELQIALDYLMETTSDFPSIAKIKGVLMDRSNSEFGNKQQYNPEILDQVLTGVRLCERALGFPTAEPQDVPSWLPDLVDKATASAKAEVAKLVREHYIALEDSKGKELDYAAGAINLLVRRR